MPWKQQLRAVLLLAGILACAGSRDLSAKPLPGATAFILDGNRIYATVDFILADGTARPALLFVDLGSPSMTLSPELAQELQVPGGRPLTMHVGALPVNVDSRAVTSDPDLPYPLGNHRVDGVLPAGVMKDYVVVLDYARRRLTLARKGSLPLQGIAVPFRLNEKTGLIAVDATIDGQAHPITIDDGSGYSWIRRSTAEGWFGRHPDWQRGLGAVGPSNMRMADDGIEASGSLVRIPEVALGTLRLDGVGALAIGPDNKGQDFMDWYSAKNAVPVIGWLGGNALRAFKITIDYPDRISYWAREAPDADDFDYVGLTFQSQHHKYSVAGIARRDGRPTVAGVLPGDHLTQVDGLNTDGVTREAIFAALHGRPGDTRVLTLERKGKVIRVETHVTDF